jgi:hypothetical protein
VLLEKYRSAGGERRMKCGVQRIVSAGTGAPTALVLDSGERDHRRPRDLFHRRARRPIG